MVSFLTLYNKYLHECRYNCFTSGRLLLWNICMYKCPYNNLYCSLNMRPVFFFNINKKKRRITISQCLYHLTTHTPGSTVSSSHIKAYITAGIRLYYKVPKALKVNGTYYGFILVRRSRIDLTLAIYFFSFSLKKSCIHEGISSLYRQGVL